MIIGVPKEIKVHEYRVGMIPASVVEAVAHGHKVYVETLAGQGIGFSDQDYIDAGAIILPSAAAVFAEADMIVKVKEPQAIERAMLREGQILFTYLHLAPDPEQTHDLINSKAICIAYETVTDDKGRLPLLAPMSEVAGRMSIQAGALALEKSHGGKGLLLAGVPGVEPAKVVILGGGVVGANAAQMAIGLRANVVILDRNLDVLRQLDQQFSGQVQCIYSTKESVEKHVLDADLVVGCVLVAGAAAPKLVTADMIKKMQPGSAIVDVAIDQGGCVETSHPTTHNDPTYLVDDVVHYCVANMPGAVARTSTFALNNATLPYILKLANMGYKKALQHDKHLLNGLNVYRGKVTCESVSTALDLPYYPADKAIN
ncbi:alanine dehydrogenase [Photobacterium damselae subsp. damselae]|uniref:alanine dehydrogenase n=1 Tax=Photobacterium damselae TaxID=38293 RepID=UPI0010FD86DF|nr:alanine dehydrogenase [Photobacterium damselae]MBA5682312.1 alanine dehydrogenase [Photobacterium damselae subsp. damselae]NVH49966.1 alanine dehydrogenase [Photobacterium damselae subsp. damselae]NVO81993.1 alanine dehydrogenase [Photobacterium damselae subsp. damselae]TLS80412.1 alanine dehydrogenase [Photobacterium damselae subsp. damselae]TLS86334.1 alanine dehydrogenase [Photobacterium damselae subsp. damselae]